MTKAEISELFLIPLAGACAWLVGTWLPNSIGVGSLLLASSVLLLLQGLLRDIWLLFQRKTAQQSGERQKLLCMCVESTVGVSGVVAGLVVLGSALDWPVPMTPWLWGLLAIAVLILGFAVKDLIFEFRPFRVRRDKDHLNIVFSWKS